MLQPLSGPSSPVASGGPAAPYVTAVEVETEFEDEALDEQEGASPMAGGGGRGRGDACGEEEEEEVEEELESTAYDPDAAASALAGEDCDESSFASGGVASGSAGGGGGADYAVPEKNKEVWKNFGYNTEAGRALRRLYQTGSQRDVASKVSYPRMESPSQRWEPKAAARKPCPQRAPVRVPRAAGPKYDPDDPRNWRVPVPGRKPGAQILAEMESEQPQVPNLPRGRDQAAEKQNLQARFQFCGGNAMPKGAMGYVAPCSDLPQVIESMRGRMEQRREKDENGMNAEQREIFEELMLAIKRKQERLLEIDEEDAADKKPSKARTARNKEALELRNDIDRNLADIDRLLELAG